MFCIRIVIHSKLTFLSSWKIPNQFCPGYNKINNHAEKDKDLDISHVKSYNGYNYIQIVLYDRQIDRQIDDRLIDLYIYNMYVKSRGVLSTTKSWELTRDTHNLLKGQSMYVYVWCVCMYNQKKIERDNSSHKSK